MYPTFFQVLIQILSSEPLWILIGDLGAGAADSSDDDDSVRNLDDFDDFEDFSTESRYRSKNNPNESAASYFISVVEFIVSLLEASRGHQSLVTGMLEIVLSRKVFADLGASPDLNSKARPVLASGNPGSG